MGMLAANCALVVLGLQTRPDEKGSTPEDAVKAVAAAAEAAMARRHVPGLALAAVTRDRAAFASVGIRDADGKPVTPDSRFYVASCTKTYTAMLLEKMAEADELELDDPIRTVLPAFQLADEAAAASITIRDLLCHRPGLDCGNAVLLDAYTGEITDDRFFRLLALEKPLGRCRYTNVHFTLAARAAEAVRGKPWQELLEEELFEPLGMTRTTARASRAFADPDAAWPLEPVGRSWRRLRVKSDRTMHAAGGLCTTARDAAAWLRLHLGGGTLDGVELVAPKTMQDALTVQAESKDRLDEPHQLVVEGFGLAWQLGTIRGRRVALHGGGYRGTAALYLFLPDDGIGALALSNCADAGMARAAVLALIDAQLGIGGTDTLGWLGSTSSSAPALPPAPPRGATAEELKLALAALTGTFRDADFGTLALRVEDSRLLVSFGELPGVVLPSESGAWRLVFDDGEQEFAAKPILESGRLRALELDVRGRKPRFERDSGG